MSRSIRKLLKDRLKGYDKIVVWGSGSMARGALKILPNNVLFAVDPMADGHMIGGKPVKSINSLKNLGDSVFVVIATFAHKEAAVWLEGNTDIVNFGFFHDLIVDFSNPNSEVAKLRGDLAVAFTDNWFETFIRRPQLFVNITFRLCAALKNNGSRLAQFTLYPMRLLHAFNCAFFGIDIPISVQAGTGLQFIHFGGIVLHEDVILGTLCKIYQSTTLGADKTGKAPSLGNNVIIWSNAVVIGGCRLGDNCQVGANSVCLGNMDADNAVLVGAPARIMRFFERHD